MIGVLFEDKHIVFMYVIIVFPRDQIKCAAFVHHVID